MCKNSIFFSLLIAISFAARADSDDVIIVDRPNFFEKMTNISAQEIYARTQAVLKYYQVPAEEDAGTYLSDLKNSAKTSEIQRRIKWMDPLNYFSKISQIVNNELFVFSDMDSKKVLDFSIPLKLETQESIQSKENLTLKGLRVALDPGHMGGSAWDKQTGKYVKDKQGHLVSEGLINLQTSLLLKVELEKLGAQVLITRSGLKPATDIDSKKFDLKPIALSELRDNIHANWFQSLIKKAAAGPELFKLFDNSPEVKKIFSESTRSEYFIKRVDLWERARQINEFNPDIALIIHYDTADTSSGGLNPQAPRQTKSFVFGSYEQNEMGSSEARKYFTRHLLDQKSWDLSVSLSRSIVNKMKFGLNLELDASTGTGTKLVEPGIIARNLLVSRMLKTPAVAYLECLFYNRPDEFASLAKTNHSMIIDGQDMPYSDRIIQVSNAIRDGVLDFYQNNQELSTHSHVSQ